MSENWRKREEQRKKTKFHLREKCVCYKMRKIRQRAKQEGRVRGGDTAFANDLH